MRAACPAIVTSHSRGHGAQRVRRVADAHERIALDRRREALDPTQVGLDAAIAEAPLAGARPAAGAPARVRGQQEHDANAHCASGLDHGERELVRLLVRRAVRAVVDVVELAHGGVAGPPARIEALLGDGSHATRVERVRGRVHGFAPRPEVVLGRRGGTHLDATAQMALERVRVAVDEARNEQPARQAHDIAPLPRAGRVADRGDLAVHHFDGRPRTHRCSRLEHEIGDEQRAAHGSIGRSRPRSRAVSRARL